MSYIGCFQICTTALMLGPMTAIDAMSNAVPVENLGNTQWCH